MLAGVRDQEPRRVARVVRLLDLDRLGYTTGSETRGGSSGPGHAERVYVLSTRRRSSSRSRSAVSDAIARRAEHARSLSHHSRLANSSRVDGGLQVLDRASDSSGAV